MSATTIEAKKTKLKKKKQAEYMWLRIYTAKKTTNNT